MKREHIDKYIERLKENKKMFEECKEKPLNFFHVLLDCPHDELPRLVVANHICKGLNAIYERPGFQWQVVNYNKNIVLGFGKSGYCPPLYFDSGNEYVTYKRLDEYDCLSINVEKNTFYEAEYAVSKIFSDLKKAGF